MRRRWFNTLCLFAGIALAATGALLLELVLLMLGLMLAPFGIAGLGIFPGRRVVPEAVARRVGTITNAINITLPATVVVLLLAGARELIVGAVIGVFLLIELMLYLSIARQGERWVESRHDD